MPYVYYLKIDKTLTGTTFHSFSKLLNELTSLENPHHLGNFYLTINLKAKIKCYEKAVRSRRIINHSLGRITNSPKSF